MSNSEVPVASGFILSEVADILSDKDYQYQKENPEAGIVVYDLTFRFLILHYVEGQGAVWDYVEVDKTATEVDAWKVFLEAQSYVSDEYQPIEMYFLGVEVNGAYVVNVPHESVVELPEEYWFDWEDALSGEVSEIEEADLEWE
ncbi:MAG: hypothetical protein JHC26_09010 [Thermofilum sp.]|jgi:hypothetical protein|uniref:hypothetical protein n=1 Tax=Thermofilum sp. TaxID=1961369 RepID=UPI002590BA1D|nr:hypothetical protein [Thermofilum sp.]MCI4409218.1 hypothetical protein [Thermofilum sp.]